MIEDPIIIAIESPTLLDQALLGFQEKLLSKLVWLDYAFGKCEKQINSNKEVYPAIYQGKRNYLNMLPDSHIGNYSYFDVNDGIEVLKNRRHQVGVGLVIFFNIEKVYPNHEEKSIEHIKEDVLFVLSKIRVPGVAFDVIRIYEDAKNIYKGYDHKESHRQFMKRPFGALRLEGQLQYRTNC